VPRFYTGKNVTAIARQLLGKVLITCVNGKLTGGMIVETEAYSFRERGCHAFDNRMTLRNQVMFEAGGVAYVYLCYGIHHMFNVVTNQAGVAEAVLVRALEPLHGIEHMMERMQSDSSHRITSGPGKLTKALGIDKSLNGCSLFSNSLWIEEGQKISPKKIMESKRIGVEYAGADANLPWRFHIRDNPWVSK
jgi:DNA-3-methyladenine glycosylase